MLMGVSHWCVCAESVWVGERCTDIFVKEIPIDMGAKETCSTGEEFGIEEHSNHRHKSSR
jgi:hypothetical protein